MEHPNLSQPNPTQLADHQNRQITLYFHPLGFAELHLRPQRRPPARLLHCQRDPQELPRRSRVASLGGRAHGLRFPQRLPPNEADGEW